MPADRLQADINIPAFLFIYGHFKINVAKRLLQVDGKIAINRWH